MATVHVSQEIPSILFGMLYRLLDNGIVADIDEILLYSLLFKLGGVSELPIEQMAGQAVLPIVHPGELCRQVSHKRGKNLCGGSSQLDVIVIEHDAERQDPDPILPGQDAEQGKPNQTIDGRIKANAPVGGNLINVIVPMGTVFSDSSHATNVDKAIRFVAIINV